MTREDAEKVQQICEDICKAEEFREIINGDEFAVRITGSCLINNEYIARTFGAPLYVGDKSFNEKFIDALRFFVTGHIAQLEKQLEAL